MDLFYTQHFRGIFTEVYHVNIYCQNKSVAQNIQIKRQNEKKYLFSTERSFFSHSLHLCQWIYYCHLFNPVHKYEYGIYQAKDPLLKYNYCNMESYFYTNTSLVTILSMICSVQAFRVQKLPSNFNETSSIFLGMFTATFLLVVSIPLNGSFYHDNQKIFVNSIVIFYANIALLSIACGYKIHILLFEKHRNTKKLSRSVCAKLWKITWW